MDNEIDTLQLNIVVNSSSAVQNLREVQTAVNDIIAKIPQFDAKTKRIQTTLNKTGETLSKSEKNGGGSWGLYRAIIRLAVVYRLLYRVSKALTGIVEKGINFNETLNLWQVAMRGNVDQATQFVDEMSKAYGYATTTLMQYQATFRNMVSALGGISADASYTLSEALVAFGTDFASLYNTTLETAMEKLQAVLAGQIRPIRAISGYDVSKNTIYQLYKQIGGKKAQGEITETEKRLLRVYAVMVQMQNAGALGDMEKTLNNSANQLRIMKELAKEFFTWIGNGVQVLFESSGIFQKINTYLYAGVELAKSFAYNVGYVQKDFTLDTLFEDVNDEIDEAQGKLASFDKFNVLSQGAQGKDTVSQNIISAISAQVEAWKENMRNSENYMSLLNKAKEILEKLGLVQEAVTDETGKEVGYVWKLVSGAGSLLSVIKLIGGALTSISITLSVIGIAGKIKALMDLGKLANIAKVLKVAFSPLGITLMAIATAIIYLYTTNKEFRDSINELAKSVFSLIKSTLMPFISVIKDILGLVTIILDSIVAPVLTYLIKIVAKVIEAVSAFLKLEGVLQALKVIIYATLVAGVLLATRQITILVTSLYTMKDVLIALKASIKSLITPTNLMIAGIVLLVAQIALLTTSWDKMEKWEKWVGVIGAIASALVVAAAAAAAFHVSLSAGIQAAAIVAGLAAVGASIALFTSQAKKASQFAAGGTAEKGSLFLAGEAGPELVTTTSGGNSTIMNMQQLENAVARGFMRAMVATDGTEKDVNVTINLGGKTLSTVYDLLKAEGKRRGDSWR